MRRRWGMSSLVLAQRFSFLFLFSFSLSFLSLFEHERAGGCVRSLGVMERRPMKWKPRGRCTSALGRDRKVESASGRSAA